VRRLPWSTPGTYLIFTAWEGDYYYRSYGSIGMFESELRLTMGNSFYDPEVGSDHESDWVFEVDAYGRFSPISMQWLDRLKTILADEPRLQIENESEGFDWDDEKYDTDWETELRGLAPGDEESPEEDNPDCAEHFNEGDRKESIEE
jgi:hypothetical protein